MGFRISVSARASPGRIWRLLFVPALGDSARSLVPVAFCFFPLSGKRVDSAADMLSARILGGFGNCSADRQKPGRWRRDVSDQMDERLHRLPIARGRQAVLDGTLPREKGRGMPIAKKDEAGADLGATATAAFPPFHQIFVFLLSKILLPD